MSFKIIKVSSIKPGDAITVGEFEPLLCVSKVELKGSKVTLTFCDPMSAMNRLREGFKHQYNAFDLLEVYPGYWPASSFSEIKKIA
jgi:hypothetical protein